MSYPKVISIYSGAGGLDIGFHKAGYKIVYSTDLWEPACETLKINRLTHNVERKDIRDIDFRELLKRLKVKEVDCVVGGPPCPPYSKSRFYLKDKKRALKDSNSFTLEEYFRVIKEVNPKAFFFENVHGFVYKPHMEAFNFLKRISAKLGYNITHQVVNAANFGVPQIRERFVCVGVKKGLPKFAFPKETHYNAKKTLSEDKLLKKPWTTCKDAIGHLDTDLPEDKKMKAGSRHHELLKMVPPGDNYLYFTKKRGYPKPIFIWRSRYWSFLLKLSPSKPSWTIQASHSNNMGPFHWKNRFLRIEEIKKIQTFDKNYKIVGDYKHSGDKLAMPYHQC